MGASGQELFCYAPWRAFGERPWFRRSFFIVHAHIESTNVTNHNFDLCFTHINKEDDMFGFVRPDRRSSYYRNTYCRCCSNQRYHYGLVSLPFLTYESAFLYMLAMDAMGEGMSMLNRQRCCVLPFRRAPVDSWDAEVGRFAASISMLLALIKLDDNIRDANSLIARILRWAIGDRCKKAIDYFATLDGDFLSTLTGFINDHHQLETRGEEVTISQYADPTAKAYGYVFGLLGSIPNLEPHKDTFSAIGENIGAATIAFDCASDWQRDAKRRNFNPIWNDTQAVAALAYSQMQLRDATIKCSEAFGSTCHTAEVLVGVHNRIYSTCKKRWGKIATFIESACLLPQQQKQDVILYVTCCVPCGNGAIGCDSEDCSKTLGYIGCACCCCYMCMSGSSHK
jgi:Family of unknown function (DUF5685)